MEIRVVAASLTEVPADAVVVNLFEGVRTPGGATGAVDRVLGGTLSDLIAAGEIQGKLHETTLLHVSGQPFRRVLVVGLGKPEEFGSLALELARNTYFNGQCIRLDGAIRMAPR